MPALVAGVSRLIDSAASIAELGEWVWLYTDRASPIRSELRPSRLEAIYELAFLRIFLAWEVFLEESFLRYLCGYSNSVGCPALLGAPCRTIDDARNTLLGGSSFVSWYSPDKIRNRSKTFMSGGLHEVVISSFQAQLEAYACVRHRIAHSSRYAVQQFDAATNTLAGRRYLGSRPGRFLRDLNPGGTPPRRWLYVIADDLRSLAAQIVP